MLMVMKNGEGHCASIQLIVKNYKQCFVPGENLLDCDKDDEEGLEKGCSKCDDEEESENGFFIMLDNYHKY